MKAKEIQELLDFISGSGLDEVNIETDTFKLAVKRNSGVVRYAEAATAPVAATPIPVQIQATPSPAPAATPPAAAQQAQDAGSKTITIKSPMIGTFYRTAKPDMPPFVKEGDEVKKGQTVCIIEAMKLFNEIESEFSGKIVKVLVENATPVEYDQPLFIIEQA